MSDSAVTIVVSGVIQVTVLIVGFLTLWVKLRYGVEKSEEAAAGARITNTKVDHNTAITRAGTEAAVENARIAATTAADAKVAVDSISRRLNGGIDSAIAEALAPIMATLSEHSAKFEELATYTHQRNHDLLNVIQSQVNKLEIVLESTKALRKT